mgnify:CR=1 FL=1
MKDPRDVVISPIVSEKSYEQLENIINAWLNGDDATDDNDVETTTTFKNTKSNKKTESKTASDSFDSEQAFSIASRFG